MNNLRTIEVARQFTTEPGGRFIKHGPFSGEKFRIDVLLPALTDARKSGSRVTVVLDGVAGYAGSFLEEAFGGLVRIDGFTSEELSRLLEIRAEDAPFSTFRDLAWRYIRRARPGSVH